MALSNCTGWYYSTDNYQNGMAAIIVCLNLCGKRAAGLFLRTPDLIGEDTRPAGARQCTV